MNVSYSVFNHVISQNGYTRYPNYLLKSLKKLTPLHRAIMIEIHEYTFSHFKSDSKLKTTAKIDRAELALRCCVSQKTIKRGLKYLVELNYIEVTKEKFNSVILSVKNLIMDSFFRDALESRIEETNESDTTQKTENIIKTDNVSGKMDNLSGKKDNLSEFSSIPNNFTDTFSDSSKQDCVKSNKNENSKNFNLGLLGKIGGKRLTQSRANYLLNKYGLTNTSLQDLIDAFNRELRASNINGSKPIYAPLAVFEHRLKNNFSFPHLKAKTTQRENEREIEKQNESKSAEDLANWVSSLDFGDCLNMSMGPKVVMT